MDTDAVLLVMLNSTVVGYFFSLFIRQIKQAHFFLYCRDFQGLFQSRCINCNKTEVRGEFLSLHPTERDYGEWKVWVMTWLLLLDRVNPALGSAGESPLEGQPVLVSLKHISPPANLIRVKKKKKKSQRELLYPLIFPKSPISWLNFQECQY